MSEYESEISSVCTAISSVCFTIAIIVIAVLKLINNSRKKQSLDLKIKHLNNVIEAESRPQSVVQPHIVIDMKDGKRRYSFDLNQSSLSPSEVNPTAKTN